MQDVHQETWHWASLAPAGFSLLGTSPPSPYYPSLTVTLVDRSVYLQWSIKKESLMSNPNQNVDHSSTSPLKSDEKAGVQPNQQPGPKVPKQGDQQKSEKDCPNKGEGNENTEYSGGT